MIAALALTFVAHAEEMLQRILEARAIIDCQTPDQDRNPPALITQKPPTPTLTRLKGVCEGCLRLS